MKATIPFIEQKFEEFNKLIFNNKLPKVPVKLTKAKTFLGACAFKKKKKIFGKDEFFDFQLRFSTSFDFTERELEDTIIHEMIHYYIGYFQLKDTSLHGAIFRKIMNDINLRFNRNVTISNKIDGKSVAKLPDDRKKWRVVAVVRFHDGKVGIKVLPKVQQSVKKYCKTVISSSKIASVDVYWSDSLFFERFPSSAALRVYFVEPAVLNDNMKNAVAIDMSRI